jgi:predicted RNA-binding protein YlqC (UPF0109 family)
MIEPIKSIGTAEHMESMRFLMEVMVRALVDSRESVNVKAVSAVSGTALVVNVAIEDIGKVIGKQGRIARSLRTILGAASKKSGHCFSLDLQEVA